MSSRISFSRYLVEQQGSKGNISAELRLLLEVVARACKAISHAVNKGALGGVLGSADRENVQGEVQKSLTLLPMMCSLMPTDGVVILQPWRPKRWTRFIPCPTATPRASTCCCSIRSTAQATSTSTSASAPFSVFSKSRREVSKLEVLPPTVANVFRTYIPINCTSA
jgi:hypothetical protein